MSKTGTTTDNGGNHTTQNTSRSLSLSTHPEYHVRGGDLHFIAARTMFRVNSYFFDRESKFWRDRLAGPVSPGDTSLTKGTNSANAIVIDESPEDFSRLLWVWYNDDYGDYSAASLDNWLTILRLATKWEFPKIKKLAIQHLEKFEMGTVDRIVLYKANSVSEKYLFPLYEKLVSREERLRLDESQALGIETLVLVHEARERLRAPSGSRLLSPVRTDLKPTDIIDIVASTFNISLADVDAEPGKPGGGPNKQGQGDKPPKGRGAGGAGGAGAGGAGGGAGRGNK